MREDVLPLFPENVHRSAHTECPDDVLLGFDPGELRSVILLDNIWIELILGYRLFPESPFEHLPVELPEQHAPVLHEHDVGHAHEDHIVREWGGHAREWQILDPPLSSLYGCEHLPRVLHAHDLGEYLLIGLSNDRELLEFVESVQEAARPELLSGHREYLSLVVPEDHEAPGRDVSETL